MKRILRFLLRFAFVVALFAVAGLVWARQLLVVETTPKPKPAQVAIVLGGDGTERASRAVELLAAGYAPRVLVTGETNSTHAAVEKLRSARVPDGRIIIEPKATSTRENAEFTVPLLRQQHITNAILVTSWYHSRRALATFHKVAPDIQIQSFPTKAVIGDYNFPRKEEIGPVLKEFGKIAWYGLRWQIF